ncbi:MAG: hypothetical protein U0703_16700 [Anaerolineae bacterium]
MLALPREMWLLWLLLLLLFGRIYATPLDMITPMDPRRKLIAVLGLVVFVITSARAASRS